MNLENFKTNNNLFEATTQFLKEQLHIKFTPFTNQAFTAQQFFNTNEHRAANKNIALVSKFYVMGVVNHESLTNTISKITIEDLKNQTKDYDGLVICALQINDNQKPNRTQLAEITRLINREFPTMPVMVLFRYDSKISIANTERIPYLINIEGEKVGKVSMLKDIEIENPHRAHLDILKDLAKHNAKTFEELYKHWQEKLNTKELNNKFYQELFKWYLYAKDNVVFPNDNEEESDKYLSESLIRFISRMLFVWFMKEKSLITHKLFETNELKNILKNFDEKSNQNIYYKAILQNLFFATLNVPTENRKWIDGKKRNKAQQGDPLIYRYEKEFRNSEEVIENIFMKIPFLNGGLFDCLDDRENNIFIDGFTKNEKKQPQFPNYLFFGENKNIDLSHYFADDAKEKRKWQNQNITGIIELLNDYKFTIEENTPLEIDVALDPELLGKVFENLLASFNPETKATARKQTGSFYTPREIVNYMVDESLKAYLSSSFECTSSFQLEEKLRARSSKCNQYEVQTTSGWKPEVHWKPEGYFDPNNEIIIHKKKLPHWQQKNVWYFVTFRLFDSIPEEKKEEIRREREIWDKNHKNKKEYTKEDWIMYNKLFHENTEKLLNSGYGKCLMNKKENADIVANALLHFNNERYTLDEWVVMPNHVHVLVKPIDEHYLGDILHSWKSFTANEINKKEGLSGQLWMTESYDHIVRNRESFNAFRYYIRENPSKAKITVLRASSSEQTVLRASSSEQTVLRASSSEQQFEQDARSTISSEHQFEQDARSTNSSEISFKQGTVLRASSSKEVQSTVLELFSITSYEQMSDTLRARSSEYVQALFNCKILDPACGSGAYPMGVLHKMVELMTILDPKNEHLKEREGKKLDDLIKSAKNLSDTNTRNQTIEALQKQKDILQKAEYDYVRKLYIIENCIYGVDIQPIAIQISKLRFFISLLVEQNKKEDQPNFGIEPLPNMDFKLVAANTLIAPPQEDRGTGLFADQDPFFETFENLAHDYFTLHTPEEKKTKKQEIITLIKEKIEEKKRLIASVKSAKALEDSVKLWESYQNLFKEKAVGFFETKYFFPKVKEGFDVVIGNPPYVQMQKDGGYLAELYKNQNFETYERTGDIYALFYENGIKLLKQNGNLNYITSNKWMRAKSGESLRTFFIKNNPVKLIDLGAGVFENATVDTNIILVTKKENQNNCLALDLTKVKNITDFKQFEDNWTVIKNLTQDSWAILSGTEDTIKQKIETIGKPLKDWDINIYRGILTGFNEAFIIDAATKEKLCAEDPKSAEIIKPILRGKDIKKYKAEWAGLWLIATHNGYKEKDKRIPRIEIENYPAIKKHLDQFLPQLTKRSDKGDTPYNLRNCAYMNDFEKEKIVWAEMTNENNFIWEDSKSLVNQTCYFIANTNKFVLSVLNSKITKYYMSIIASALGEGAFRWIKIYVEQIPIPEIPEPAQQPFISLVNQILEGKKTAQDTSHLEHQIDVMVYHLYELSYEEACVIDKELKEEDYRTSSFQLEA